MSHPPQPPDYSATVGGSEKGQQQQQQQQPPYQPIYPQPPYAPGAPPPQQPYPPAGPQPAAGYQPQPQPGGGGYYQPPNTTVVIQQPGGPYIYDRDDLFPTTSVQTTCPNCNARVQTLIGYELGALVWIVALVMCFVGLLLCAWIPCLIDDLKDVVHTCPNCKAVVGRNNRLGTNRTYRHHGYHHRY